MKVGVKVDDAQVLAGLKAARRDIDQGVKEGLRRAARIHGLPRAKSLSPSRRIRAALHAGATTRTAYIELKKRDVPFGPLLEFGGTRRDTLLPRVGKAIMTPAGPRAAVRGHRHYRAQRFMQRAVEQTLPEVLRDAQDAIAEELSHHLDVS